MAVYYKPEDVVSVEHANITTFPLPGMYAGKQSSYEVCFKDYNDVPWVITLKKGIRGLDHPVTVLVGKESILEIHSRVRDSTY